MRHKVGRRKAVGREAHVTAGVEILPYTPPVLHAGASVRDAQGRQAQTWGAT
jgi:hypothetical protein